MGIEDISEFVAYQRQVVLDRKFDQLVTPLETVYTVTELAVVDRPGLDHGRP